MSCCTSCDSGKPCESELKLNAEKWIASAIKHPGSFKAYAKANGGLDADGKVKEEWAKALINKKGVSETVKKRARLFLTLKKMH